jgi:hypothetical protein
MNFIQKLTEDTLNGEWDFGWKYTDSTKTYAFNVTKHYLTGMNFSLEKDPEMLILPNGYGLIYNKEAMVALRDAVDVSLESTADQSIEAYLSGEGVSEEESVDGESVEDGNSEQPIEEKPKEKVTSVKKNKKAIEA